MGERMVLRPKKRTTQMMWCVGPEKTAVRFYSVLWGTRGKKGKSDVGNQWTWEEGGKRANTKGTSHRVASPSY